MVEAENETLKQNSHLKEETEKQLSDRFGQLIAMKSLSKVEVEDTLLITETYSLYNSIRNVRNLIFVDFQDLLNERLELSEIASRSQIESFINKGLQEQYREDKRELTDGYEEMKNKLEYMTFQLDQHKTTLQNAQHCISQSIDPLESQCFDLEVMSPFASRQSDDRSETTYDRSVTQEN